MDVPGIWFIIFLPRPRGRRAVATDDGRFPPLTDTPEDRAGIEPTTERLQIPSDHRTPGTGSQHDAQRWGKVLYIEFKDPQIRQIQCFLVSIHLKKAVIKLLLHILLQFMLFNYILYIWTRLYFLLPAALVRPLSPSSLSASSLDSTDCTWSLSLGSSVSPGVKGQAGMLTLHFKTLIKE